MTSPGPVTPLSSLDRAQENAQQLLDSALTALDAAMQAAIEVAEERGRAGERTRIADAWGEYMTKRLADWNALPITDRPMNAWRDGWESGAMQALEFFMTADIARGEQP